MTVKISMHLHGSLFRQHLMFLYLLMSILQRKTLKDLYHKLRIRQNDLDTPQKYWWTMVDSAEQCYTVYGVFLLGEILNAIRSLFVRESVLTSVRNSISLCE